MSRIQTVSDSGVRCVRSSDRTPLSFAPAVPEVAFRGEAAFRGVKKGFGRIIVPRLRSRLRNDVQARDNFTAGACYEEEHLPSRLARGGSSLPFGGPLAERAVPKTAHSASRPP